MTRRLAKRRHAEAPYQPWLRWSGLRTALLRVLGSSHGLSVLRVVTAVASGSRGRHRWSNWARALGTRKRICVRHLRSEHRSCHLNLPCRKMGLKDGEGGMDAVTRALKTIAAIQSESRGQIHAEV